MPPTSRQQRIDWIKAHLGLWTQNADDIGLTPEEVAQLQTLFTTADNNWENVKTKRDQLKTASITARTSWSAVNSMLGPIIKRIRSYAELTGNEEVYGMAGIDPPAPPSPMGPPGMATNVTATPDNMGRVVIRWKATNAAPSTGAAFQIRRKLEGETRFKVIGTAQARRFTDSGIPEGTASATCSIKGFRGDIAGIPSEPVIVYLHSVEVGPEDGIGLAA